MTGPPSTRQTTDDRSRVRAVIEGTLGDPLTIVLGVIAFLAALPTTVFAMQTVLWDRLRRDFAETVSGETIVTVTPFDVIVSQTKVALLVGFVLALEVVVLRWRWSRSSLPRWRRSLVALVGAALLPVGAVLGYRFLSPPVFDLVGGDGWVSILRWAGLACYVSIATGVAAQIAVAGVVRGVARIGRD